MSVNRPTTRPPASVPVARDDDLSTQRLTRALAAARMVAWEWDLATDHITTSGNFAAVYGSLPPATSPAGFALLHPDDAARHQATVNEALAAGSSYVSEFRVTRQDTGATVWLEEHAASTREPDGVVRGLAGVTADITARKAADTERASLVERERAARERLQLAHAAGAIGAFDWDIETNEITWTPELEALYGLHAGGFGGHFRDWQRAVHPDDAAEAAAAAQAAVEARSALKIRFRITWPDGTIRHMLALGQVRGAPGQRRMVGVNVDVTEREEALARAQEARARAEEAVKARDAFLSIAAHELRNPVAALKGTAQLMQRALDNNRATPERLARWAADLGEMSNRLANLVNDLLDVSRLRGGRLILRPKRLRLGPIVRQVCEKSDAGVAVTVDDSARASVVVDPDRLRQVLENLLDNARKYSLDGGGVRVSLADSAGGVLMRVTDEGIGLPAGEEERIFQPFGRASNAAAYNIPGLGLGLYLCRQIVEAHHGRLWATSAGVGQGVTISLWLPSSGVEPEID